MLAEGGAPEALARPAAATLGEGAAEVLREDPWQLLSVPGVRPEQADGFARALLGAGCGPDDERRTAALVGWLLERAALRGHTAMDADEVRTALAGFAVTDPAEAVQHAVAEGVVLVFQDDEAEEGVPEPERAEETGEPSGDAPQADQEPVQVLLGLDRYALAEESLADGLARLVNSCEKGADWTDAAAAAPSPSAGELIRAAATAGLVAHSGGETARAEPAALIAAAHGLGLRALGTTHSADGQRRLAAAVGDPRSAVTLSALLSGEDGPGRDADGAFALDVLVVLDAPQLDVETAAMLVESLADGTRLILSGDPGVLGSAGAGRVFADVIAARSCPHVVSRTPDPGPIGELVSGIGIGELTQVEAPGREVVIVPVRDPGEAVHRTVQLVADSVPRAIGVPSPDTQVITVGHGGPAGTTALNAALKQRLNPGPGRFGGFDPGDRVVHVPAPGRAVPGSVVSADAEGLHLDCAGTPVVVPQERVETSVRHSWALSAHQAAGMRWPAVVVVLPGDAAQQLSRPWVYTAFSRGSATCPWYTAWTRPCRARSPRSRPRSGRPGCAPCWRHCRRRTPRSGTAPGPQAPGHADGPGALRSGAVGRGDQGRSVTPSSGSASSSSSSSKTALTSKRQITVAGSASSKGAPSHSPGSGSSSTAETQRVESPSSRPNSLCREAISSASYSPKTTPSAACTPAPAVAAAGTWPSGSRSASRSAWARRRAGSATA